MDSIKRVEQALLPWFGSLPSLPQASRRLLTRIWPAIAMVMGVAQLIAAFVLWGTYRAASGWGEYSEYYVRQPDVLNGHERVLALAALVLAIVNAFILFTSVPELLNRTRRGWGLLFLGVLIYFVYALIALLATVSSLGRFIISMSGGLAGLYLAFQVRNKYGSA